MKQVQRLASQNAKASLEEIRKRSEEEKAAWQREKKEMQQQVNRLQEEVLAAANAHASLEEIRVQQNDHINKLLYTEKMSAKQATQELDAEKMSATQGTMPSGIPHGSAYHPADLAAFFGFPSHMDSMISNIYLPSHRMPYGSMHSGYGSEMYAVPLPAAAPPNTKQKQNMPGVQQQACEVLRSLAYDAGTRSKIAEACGIEAVVAGMQAHKASVLVQEPACASLRSLAFNDSNKFKIAGAGGIEAVLSAMKAHTASVFVQQHACAAL